MEKYHKKSSNKKLAWIQKKNKEKMKYNKKQEHKEK